MPECKAMSNAATTWSHSSSMIVRRAFTSFSDQVRSLPVGSFLDLTNLDVITFCCLLIPLLAIYVGQAQEQARSKSLTFQLEYNLIRVPVSVNGHTAHAVLDSGSGALVLDRSFALSIGIKPGLTSGDVAGGGGPSAM